MSKAVISKDGLYRYTLEREILKGPGRKPMLFIMLNPSTADAKEDDPTIRRCLTFAARERASKLIVCNLYAMRATDPRKLGRGDNLKPQGPDNWAHMKEAIKASGLVVVAWGASAEQHGPMWEVCATGTLKLIRDAKREPMCLGITKHGHPRHPLYVKGSQRLIPFNVVYP